MKSQAFDYAKPASLAEAIELLKSHDGRAQILAGGQSLMAIMNLRMADPELLIDINSLLILNFKCRPRTFSTIGQQAVSNRTFLNSSSSLIINASPLRCGTLTAVISSENFPVFVLSAAFV